MTARDVTIKMPVHYNVQHNTDLSLDIPAEGFTGWESRIEEVDPSQTALIVMHVSNLGLHKELPYGPDSPFLGWINVVEYIPRAMKITTEVLPSLLDSTRKAGITVAHVPSEAKKLDQFPQFVALEKAAGPEPELQSKPSPNRDWSGRYSDEMWGVENKVVRSSGQKYHDIAKEIWPEPQDIVAATSHQLTHTLSEAGIWNLIYVGYALNWCLWFSPCGMTDMSRLGYRCSAVRGATTAVEGKASARNQANLEYAYWHTATMFGHIIDLQDYLAALS